MEPRDELDQLWLSQPPGARQKREDIMTIVMKKSQRFDRTIRVRNIMECAAAVTVAPIFALAAWHATNPWISAGNAVVAASCAWILFYVLRYGGNRQGPAPDQTAAAFEKELLRKYEHQIRLLKNVKYWYLLPMYVGLILVDAGRISERVAEGRAGWVDAVAPAIYTLVFAVIWWLNEVNAAGRLRRQRDQLLALLDDAEDRRSEV